MSSIETKAPEYRPVEIARINLDGSTQCRMRLDPETINDYTKDMEHGDTFPPVVLYSNGNDFWIADGFHRIEAAKRAGLERIDAHVFHGTKRDALGAALKANANSGLRRTNADKRKAVTIALNDGEWSKLTVREIADLTGVSHTFVNNVSVELDRAALVNRLQTSKANAVGTENHVPIVEEQKEVETEQGTSARKPDHAEAHPAQTDANSKIVEKHSGGASSSSEAKSDDGVAFSAEVQTDEQEEDDSEGEPDQNYPQLPTELELRALIEKVEDAAQMLREVLRPLYQRYENGHLYLQETMPLATKLKYDLESMLDDCPRGRIDLSGQPIPIPKRKRIPLKDRMKDMDKSTTA